MKELQTLSFNVIQSYTSFASTLSIDYLINELTKRDVLIRDFDKT